MSRRQDGEIQRGSFNALVEAGVYSAGFDHPPPLKAFVAKLVSEQVIPRAADRPLRILDCGCGTGAWLVYLGSLLEEAGINCDLYGFDLSDGMVELAREKLSDLVDPLHIHRGDMLDAASYRFSETASGFDLIFAFDAVQQLPPRLQFTACERMLDRLVSGGLLLVFDHDKLSPYGRQMARKKFITRYLGIPLVPRYYCNAKYPPLSRFARQLASRPGVSARVLEADNSPKMALVIEAAGEN